MSWCTARNPKKPDEDLELLIHQQEFAFSKADMTLLAGGWGSAKTTALLPFSAVSMVMNPGCTGIMVEPTWKLLRNYVSEYFKPAFRQEIIGESKTDGILYLRNNIRVVCISGHILNRLEHYEAAWATIDEGGLMDGEVLKKTWARIRQTPPNGSKGKLRLGIAGTPHPGWLQREFEKTNNIERRIIHARTADNPHLTDVYLRGLMATCPARQRAAYMDGQFVALGGGVYPEYDAAKHVIPWQHHPDLPVVASIDWSLRTPHVLFAQLLPHGYSIRGREIKKLNDTHTHAGMVVFDELVWSDITTEQLGRKIIERGYKLSEYVCDPAGLAQEAQSGKDQIKLMTALLGVSARYSTSSAGRSIANGVDHVKMLLEPIDGIPRIYLSQDMVSRAATLPNTTRGRALSNAIPGYSYRDPKDGKPVDANPVKDGVTDHANDALRYLAVWFFPFVRLMTRVYKEHT